MVSLGVQRYDSASSRISSLSTLKHGAKLLSHLTGEVEVGLQNWLSVATSQNAGRHHAAAKFLSKVDPGVVAFLASRVVLDKAAVGSNTERVIAYAIGAAIEEEAYLLCFRREARAFWLDIQRRNKHDNMAHRRKAFKGAADQVQISWVPWGRTEKLVVGLVVLDIILRYTRLIERKVSKVPYRNKWKTLVTISITEESREWLLESKDRCALSLPAYLPCIDPPREWSNNHDGGYYGFSLSSRGLMRQRPALRPLLDDLTAGQVPVLFAGVNASQATPWAVDEDVFQVADYFWGLGTPVGGLPPRDAEEMPAKPEDIATNTEALARWKKKAHAVHIRNNSRVGHQMLVAKTLSVAKLFGDKSMYFPQMLDFRGRMYPVPAFLQPQGADLGKGLLRFAEGKPMDSMGAEWLAVHGANCFGEDKLRWDERVLWAAEHWKEVLKVAEDPLENRWWAEADKPWQFLSWCLDAVKVGPSHIPVAMDGSNNGLQIFSLMLRDPIGGRATNVLPGDRPLDIYQDVADLTMSKLRKANKPWSKLWLGFLGAAGLPRAAVKRSVMTLPYGAKRITARDYIRVWYREANPHADPAEDPLNHHVFRLADLIWESIGETVPRAIEAMSWLQECAGLVASRGKVLTWRTPIGLRVGEAYFKRRIQEVKTTLGEGVRRACRFAVDSSTLDKAKMRLAISPNLVHSLDASAMFLTVDKARKRGVTHFSMVHDSFATHAADAEALAISTREAYAELFKGNFLLDFKRQVEHETGVLLPHPPEQGDLDPREVLDSTYFFL